MKPIRSTVLLATALLGTAFSLSLSSTRLLADAKDTLNDYDVKFVKEQAAAGMAEVKVAELAVQKASRADVKAFAEMLVADHTKANSELAALAKQKGVDTSASVDPDSAKKFQTLEGYSGADFDKQFLQEMDSDHKHCISAFEDAAKDARDGDLKAWVNKTLPTLKAHHDRVKALLEQK